jgi:hypothetical protein
MKGRGNPMFGKKYQTSGMIKRTENIKGKSYEEIFGSKRAEEIKINLKKGQTGVKHNLKEVQCPYCNLIGKGPNMSRYHFDNCRKKLEE